MEVLRIMNVDVLLYTSKQQVDEDEIRYSGVQWLIPSMQVFDGSDTVITTDGEVYIMDKNACDFIAYNELSYYKGNLIDIPDFAYMLTKVMLGKSYGHKVKDWSGV